MDESDSEGEDGEEVAGLGNLGEVAVGYAGSGRTEEALVGRECV